MKNPKTYDLCSISAPSLTQNSPGPRLSCPLAPQCPSPGRQLLTALLQPAPTFKIMSSTTDAYTFL